MLKSISLAIWRIFTNLPRSYPVKIKALLSVTQKPSVSCITASVGQNLSFLRKIRKSHQNQPTSTISWAMYPTRTDFMSLTDCRQGQSCSVSMSNLNNGSKLQKNKFKTESLNTAKNKSDSTCWSYAKISRLK